MLTYQPGSSLAHALDPRAKLAVQVGLATAAFTHQTVPWLLGLTALGLVAVGAAGLSPLRALYGYRVVLLVLAFGPLVAGVALGPPWFRVAPSLDSLRAVWRLVPVLLVSAAFVHSTPVRDTRAAIQRTVPGRAGQLLGVGVGLTFRFVPLLRDDVARVREAVAARGGDQRSLRDRASRTAALSLRRALRRSDRLSLALRTRCFAYNPTLPRLAFAPRDVPVLALALGLALSPLLPL
jgi:biotin transport system permease protein